MIRQGVNEAAHRREILFMRLRHLYGASASFDSLVDQYVRELYILLTNPARPTP